MYGEIEISDSNVFAIENEAIVDCENKSMYITNQLSPIFNKCLCVFLWVIILLDNYITLEAIEFETLLCSKTEVAISIIFKLLSLFILFTPLIFINTFANDFELWPKIFIVSFTTLSTSSALTLIFSEAPRIKLVASATLSESILLILPLQQNFYFEHLLLKLEY